jgi:hypothetical protein
MWKCGVKGGRTHDAPFDYSRISKGAHNSDPCLGSGKKPFHNVAGAEAIILNSKGQEGGPQRTFQSRVGV